MIRQMLKRNKHGYERLILCTDGALRPGVTGLGIVVRDGMGQVVVWRGKRLPQAMTCNEAEYAALIFGLETVRALKPEQIQVRMDSQVVVNQMRGLFAVRNARLRRLHTQARALVATLDLDLDRVEFVYVPRLRNRLADALANEAADGVEN